MTDMKQVAERLRKVQSREMIGDVYGVEGASGTNYRFIEAALDVLISKDMGVACEDWLAERDTTPLSVEVLESFAEFDTSNDKVADWFLHAIELGLVPCLGQFRTLARLAGVELKEGNK